MKKVKIIALSLTATLVISLLLTACFGDWMGEEYATVIISLEGGYNARTLVPVSGGKVSGETHRYELIINGKTIPLKLNTANNTLKGENAPIGKSMPFELRAYVDPAIWSDHPFSTSEVLRAIGTGTITIQAGRTNSATISLYSASEVSSWAELAFAAAPEDLITPPSGRSEIIFLKPNTETNWYADSQIFINRKIELRAEGGEVKITRDATFFHAPLFSVGLYGHLTMTVGKDAALILDGNKDDPSFSDCNTSLINVNANADLTIDSGVTLQNNRNSDEGGGGVSVISGNFILKGTIKNNSGLYCGGVYVGNGGIFTMLDGTISGNDSGGLSGGVFVEGGSFTMTGGKITDNYANDGSGGVYVEGGYFRMTGGTISGNTSGGRGGGVYVNSNSGNATFDMSGGTIGPDNTASSGGGVYIQIFDDSHTTTFTMSGSAVISGNTATSASSEGGGVYMIGGTFTMNGGEISDNHSNGSWSNGGGGGVSIHGGTFNMNGGTIKNNTANTSGGGVWVDEYGTFNMSETLGISTTIENNTAQLYGGGVSVHGGGSFTMDGGTIGGQGKGNRVNSNDGGGVVVWFGGNFTMNGGTISYNQAGSVANGGGGIYIDNNGILSTFIMNGGTISYNDACGVSGSGGGVYVASGSFDISGGSITKNNAKEFGGGVYIGGGTFTLIAPATSGIITTNYGVNGTNFYGEAGATLNIEGAMPGNICSW